MTESLSPRIMPFVLSFSLHVAIGALLWITPPVRDGGRVSHRGDTQEAIVVELIPLDDSKAGLSETGIATPAIQKNAIRRPDPQITGSNVDPHPINSGTPESSQAAASASAPDLPSRASSNLAGAAAIRYHDQLLAHIGRFRQYPAAARLDHLEGTVWVRFLLDRDGRIIRLWVATSSGQSLLDQEAAAAVHRAEPLPPIPSGLPERVDITLPIDFDLG